MSSVLTHRRATWFADILLALAAIAFLCPHICAQNSWAQPGKMLDPSRTILHPHTISSFHTPLPEQYIWTVDDAAVLGSTKDLSLLKRNDWKVEPHYFRRRFVLPYLPVHATLYVAGPRSAQVWINGKPAAALQYQGKHHIGFQVMTASVAPYLRSGRNVIAIEAVRGYGSHHHTNSLKTSWLNSGEVLVVKLIPAANGMEVPPILISDKSWKSQLNAQPGWQAVDYDDTGWKPVVSVGGIESSIDFFQWNADAGMYAWPGYLGEAPYMANYRLHPVSTNSKADGLLLDFGRELDGRVVIAADHSPINAHLRYGESVGELMRAPYLGDVTLAAPAGHIARGPKSGFRYALVNFTGPHANAAIYAEGIYYPALMKGDFTCSDARLNQIWEIAAYTAHLSMQDSLLDGIKRDRGRWIGDDEVIDRVVADIYGDARLVKAGITDSLGPSPVTEHIDGLPGYSAWWVIAESEYVKRWGDLKQLRSVTPGMLELLARMRTELNAQNIYAAASGGKSFVDWSSGFSSDSPDAQRALHFEYMLAFRRAAWLLQLNGNAREAARYSDLANAMDVAAQHSLRNSEGAFGDRWQSNAIAVLAGAVHGSAERAVVWHVLSRAVTRRKSYDVITPYYGYYLLCAMAGLGHRRDALQWMRSYWGGMLDAGATSFWEAWDPAWAGEDPHAHLEADGKVGYNASLSHGWSSGPAAWMMEELLGVNALAPGFRSVQIRPELAGLAWMHGSVATPLGVIHVDAQKDHLVIGIPSGMTADVLLPAGRWTRKGMPAGEKTLAGEGSHVSLTHAGKYEFERQ